MKRNRDPLIIAPGTLRAKLTRWRGKLNREGLLTLTSRDINEYRRGSFMMPALGVLIAAMGLSLALKMVHPSAVYLLAPGAVMTEGLLFALQGVSAHRMHRRVKSLASAGHVAEQLGLDEEATNRIVVEKGIVPRCVLNDEYLYDIKDFGDADTLLRASSAPAVSPETLLRPAGHASPTPAQQLLRSSHADKEAAR